MPTDVQQFIEELGAGVFEQKLAAALGEVSAAVVDHNKAGSVTLQFNIGRVGSSYTVNVQHKITFVKPLPHGKSGEENTTETVMHVGKNGYLSIFPEDQTQMFDRKGTVIDHNNDEKKEAE